MIFTIIDITYNIFQYIDITMYNTYIKINKTTYTTNHDKITDLYNIPWNYQQKLTNKIIMKFKLEKLDASGYKISNSGIKNMFSLKLLDISYNRKITKKVIKNLTNLRYIYTAYIDTDIFKYVHMCEIVNDSRDVLYEKYCREYKYYIKY